MDFFGKGFFTEDDATRVAVNKLKAKKRPPRRQLLMMRKAGIAGPTIRNGKRSVGNFIEKIFPTLP